MTNKAFIFLRYALKALSVEHVMLFTGYYGIKCKDHGLANATSVVVPFWGNESFDSVWVQLLRKWSATLSLILAFRITDYRQVCQSSRHVVLVNLLAICRPELVEEQDSTKEDDYTQYVKHVEIAVH